MLEYKIFIQLEEATSPEDRVYFQTRQQAREKAKQLFEGYSRLSKVIVFYERFGGLSELEEFQRIITGEVMHVSHNVYINEQGDLVNCDKDAYKTLEQSQQGPELYAPISGDANEKASMVVEGVLNFLPPPFPTKAKKTFCLNCYVPKDISSLKQQNQDVPPALWGFDGK